MKYRSKIRRKFIFSLIAVMVVQLLIPVLTFAMPGRFLFGEEWRGKLHGYVYVQDPQKATVTFTKGSEVTTVTYNTYGVKVPSSPSLYDDDNRGYYNVVFNLVDYEENKIPDTVSVTDGQDAIFFTKTEEGDHTRFSGNNNPPRLSLYRIQGNQYLTTIAASSYIQANKALVAFTPVNSDANAVELSFPNLENALPYATNIDYTKLSLTDFVITDTTTGTDIALSSLNKPAIYVMDSSKNTINVEAAAPFIQGHTYILKMSPLAEGNEIRVPANGTYSGRLTIGSVFTYRVGNYSEIMYDPSNIIFFDNLVFKPASPAVSSPNTSSGGRGGGGGIVPAPDCVPVQEKGLKVSAQTVLNILDGVSEVQAVLDSEALKKALQSLPNKTKNEQRILVCVDNLSSRAKVVMSAADLAENTSSEAVISLIFKEYSYDMPLRALNIAALSFGLGTDLKQMEIHIGINQLEGASYERIRSDAKRNNITLLGPIVEFKVEAGAGGRKLEVNDFGGNYITSTAAIPQAVDGKVATALLYNPDKRELTFVPSVFSTVEDKSVVKIKRPGNGTYAIGYTQTLYNDISGHWAKADIEQLSKKMVIQGIKEKQFVPEGALTRSQLAALLVKSLGLESGTKSVKSIWKDVPDWEWYAPYFTAAANAGLIQGYEDGMMKPDDPVTREQMAVLIMRALKFTGTQTTKSEVSEEVLNIFVDKAFIQEWSKEAAAQAVNTGLMNGSDASRFVPNGNVTRAQAAVMIRRMLQLADFMNR
ncbi:S-layer homology domain-containing protein [Paenibacillus radicis (ex Xue et al. 2023)]|uniref:S-layer homology domain-containing protein n=1 Tax=Paenibacillus radicis (ex Xue et al. 2023) TaxID=2972489 RepID=A0ABT1YTC5_9BACL|nr:S-layer homology domain-containing protein [Paenibacillus radicis (ex Xue et al. 2023)]MCR8636439.1 S-layer homology domain-containing protein [Paenibacillus radicis (ex Xue et al. 2023)]